MRCWRGSQGCLLRTGMAGVASCFGHLCTDRRAIGCREQEEALTPYRHQGIPAIKMYTTASSRQRAERQMTCFALCNELQQLQLTEAEQYRVLEFAKVLFAERIHLLAQHSSDGWAPLTVV